MATFSAQIISLVGGTPDQDELDVWCLQAAFRYDEIHMSLCHMLYTL